MYPLDLQRIIFNYAFFDDCVKDALSWQPGEIQPRSRGTSQSYTLQAERRTY